MFRSIFESFVIHSFVLVLLFTFAAVSYERETPKIDSIDIIISSIQMNESASFPSAAPVSSEITPAPPAAAQPLAAKKPKSRPPVDTVKRITSKPAAKPVPVPVAAPVVSESAFDDAVSDTYADSDITETAGNVGQVAAAGGSGNFVSGPSTSEASGGGSPFDYDGLRNRLTSGIDRNKSYPYNARRRGYEGTVLVRLMIDCEGRLKDINMVESSGFEILDKEAIMLVSSVFPIKERLPEPVTLLIPVDYSLSN